MDLKNAFENYICVERQEYRDDCCGESLKDFEGSIQELRKDFLNDPESWREILTEYEDISDY